MTTISNSFTTREPKLSTDTQPKLVLVEGIMGAGKSGTAQFVSDYLKRIGVQNRLFLEGDVSHPVDFESTAFVSSDTLQNLCQKYPAYQERLRIIAKPVTDGFTIPFGLEWKVMRDAFPRQLYQDLMHYNVYDSLPLRTHQKLLVQSWKTFAETQSATDETVIFECCFMQNPMCKFVAQHNASIDSVKNHILTLSKIIAPLNPILIYLKSDIRRTIEKAMSERSDQWKQFVIQYHVGQEYGKANKLEGLEGFLSYLEFRQKLEVELCQELDHFSMVSNEAQGDWDVRLQEITNLLDTAFRCKD